MSKPLRFCSAVIGVFVLSASAHGAEPELEKHTAEGPWTQIESSRIIFFAVLQGLYEDGVSNEMVDCVIPPDENGKPQYGTHFVYACPLCMPAFEALKIYRKREPFQGLKLGGDTLGKGLPMEVVQKLQSDDLNERLPAIQGLIEQWVRRHLDKLDLTDDERQRIAGQMEMGMKRGIVMLDRFRGQEGLAPLAKRCAICDASVGACRLAPEPEKKKKASQDK